VLLWAQLILCSAMRCRLRQGCDGGYARSWVGDAAALGMCAAFGCGVSETRRRCDGVTGGRGVALAGLVWAGGGGARSPLRVGSDVAVFVAAGMLFAVLRTRMDREREASAAPTHGRNRIELEASEVSDAIACERIYFSERDVRWLDEETALCPHCGVDAVWDRRRGIPIMPGCCGGLRAVVFGWVIVGHSGGEIEIPGPGNCPSDESSEASCSARLRTACPLPYVLTAARCPTLQPPGLCGVIAGVMVSLH